MRAGGEPTVTSEWGEQRDQTNRRSDGQGQSPSGRKSEKARKEVNLRGRVGADSPPELPTGKNSKSAVVLGPHQ